MRITTDQKSLAKRIPGLSSVVPTKTSLPILGTFLLEAKQGKLSLTANDLDVSLTTILSCQVQSEGEVAVPAKKFSEIVRNLPEGGVELSAEGDRIALKCGRSRFRIVGQSAGEFPKLPEQDVLASFSMETRTLDNMVGKTIYAVSGDLTRPALCGVLWQVGAGRLAMVATDGHRLAKAELEGEYRGLEGKEFIVSPKALNVLRSLLPEKGEVRVELAENHIRFDVGESVVYSRLLEGPFPDYNQVIPKHNKKELVVDRCELADACRRVAILSSVLTHQVKMAITPETLTLSVNTPDVGEAVEEIRCSFNAEPMDVGYNARYLLDILRSVESEEVSFLLDRSDNAGIVAPMGEEEGIKYQCLLMPLRLSETD